MEADLLAALESGQLSRATLDVTDEEPLPAASPLWLHPGVRLTPHVAGSCSDDEGARLAVENWRRLRRGEKLLDMVHLNHK